MNPEVEFRQNLKEKMEASTSKEDGSFAKELEDELMKFTSNYEENKVGSRLVEQTEKIHQGSDMKVNIMECSKLGGNEAEYADTTESSSSFEDSDYGAEGVDSLGNSEALSYIHDDAVSDLDFDGSGKLFRVRKKMSHWRSFIHPIMWRCKWAELQMKKLEAQAKKYDRKLEEYSRKPTLEGSGINFPQNNVRSDVLRRKKRRRAEATNDIATYMLHHNLFSYYENRKFISEAACHVLKNPDAAQEEVNADGESWDNDEQLCVEAGNDDSYLEHILQKIEHLHSRVTEMQTKVGKVTCEHAGKFSCADSTVHMSSPPRTGYQMPIGPYIASQLMSEYNLGGLLLPESGVTNHGEFVPEANGSNNRAYPFGNEDDEILIDNQRVREEMRYFEEVKIHSVMDDQPPPEITSVSNLVNVPRGKRKGAAAQ